MQNDIYTQTIEQRLSGLDPIYGPTELVRPHVNGAKTSRAFRKSVTSSGACSVAVGPSNRARFAGARDRNNFMRIYETLY
jgi:hypothetical protein